jgi:hypothetical protein
VTFKDRYGEFQQIVRELMKIRDHNRRFKEGDPQDDLFLFAEASLGLLALERFLRILPGVKATERDTLRNLMERATSRKGGVLQFVDLGSGQPITDEARRQQVIDEITRLRNCLQHGNYEQVAAWAGVSTPAEFFKKSFASEIEMVYRITDRLVAQIDENTGEPRVECTGQPRGGEA